MSGLSDGGKIRVVHLSSAHPADDSRILWKECLSLAEAGYAVSLVVPHDGHLPDMPDGVEIVTVPHRRGRAGRMLISPLQVTLAGLRCRAAVYHFHDPELLLWGLLLRLLGYRVVYDAHEDLPRDVLCKPWIPRALRPLLSRSATVLEWAAGMALSGIVAATPVIARRFPTRRTALVQNFAKLAEFIAPPDTLPYRERRSVAYVGTITRDRCAEEMIAAIGLVKSDVLFVIAGDMRPDSLAAALAARPEWAHVCYYGRQDRAGVRRTLSEARLGLVLFHPLQTFVDSQPIKLYEYMAAGLPVIAADFPGFKAVVERNGCGICVDSRDIGAIASAIDWILNHPLEAEEMGRRGRDLVTRQFSWDVEAQTLRGLYRRILASRFHTPRRRLAAPSPKT